jgi:hypothetical protein
MNGKPLQVIGFDLDEGRGRHDFRDDMHKIERNTLGLEAKINQWAAQHGVTGTALASLKDLLGLTFPRENKPLRQMPQGPS